jgi:uncharacterized membrane protein YphA (DoxX/SURF4 family)
MIRLNQVNGKKLLITLMRMAIGWHFLYEGLSKLMAGQWTSYSYLVNTSGTFSELYHFLASDPVLLKIVDVLNMYGLTVIGLALFTGMLVRYVSLAGVLLLGLYYFAYPPVGFSLFRAGEGQLFIVDKNFIEAMALLYIAFASEKGFGLDTLISLFRQRGEAVSSSPAAETADSHLIHAVK